MVILHIFGTPGLYSVARLALYASVVYNVETCVFIETCCIVFKRVNPVTARNSFSCASGLDQIRAPVQSASAEVAKVSDFQKISTNTSVTV